MKTLLRIWKTLKWLANSPPTSLVSKGPHIQCDYCGLISSTAGAVIWQHDTSHTICTGCMKKIADHVLLPIEGNPK